MISQVSLATAKLNVFSIQMIVKLIHSLLYPKSWWIWSLFQEHYARNTEKEIISGWGASPFTHSFTPSISLA